MKVLVTLAMLAFCSQANGYGAGQVMMVPTEGKTKICQDCVNFFTDIQQMVESANMSAQIEVLIDQMLCSQLGSLQDMCKQLVKEYVPIFLQTLGSKEDPSQVCGLLGMCTQDIMKLIVKPVRKVRGEECDLCKEAITELKALVQNQQIQLEIKDLLENNVCPLFGSLAAQCKQEVEDYATLIFQLIENELDPVATCQALGLCPQSKSLPMSRVGLSSSLTKVEVIRTPEKVKAGPECVLCEFVMKELEDMLSNNATQAEIEAALDEVCSYLPKSISQQCKAFVDAYAPMIIQLLLKEADPKTICTQLGLCQAPRLTAPDPACLLCEFVLSEIDTLIGNNKSQASVEAAMKKVCDMMPVTISAECRAFVDDYGKAVINLLVKELDPTAVCKTLRFCTGTKTLKVVKPVKQVKKTVSASPECIVCEFIMKELDTLLTDNSTQAEIEAALDAVCSRLPTTVRQECVTFVNTYSPAVLQLLVQELDPQIICTTLGLCSQTKLQRAHVPLKKMVGSEKCDLCVTVLNYVSELAKENMTAQEAEYLLDKVCNFLSTQMKAQCLQFVDDYTPLVLNLIGNDIDPRAVCESIGLCTATRKTEKVNNKNLLFESKLLGRDKCTFGPSYWCSNKDNAVRCGTVEHCEKHVWN